MMLQEVIDRAKEVRELVDVDDQHSTTPRSVQLCFLYQVLTAIATGQCKDYPPEEFAAEALKCYFYTYEWAKHIKKLMSPME